MIYRLKIKPQPQLQCLRALLLIRSYCHCKYDASLLFRGTLEHSDDIEDSSLFFMFGLCLGMRRFDFFYFLVQVEEQSPSTLASAESSFRERANLECPETDHARSEETMSPGSSECTESVSSSFSSVRSSEITGAQADFHPVPEVGDSPMFLSRAFSSLLELLQVTDTEAQTGPECAAALDQDEKMGPYLEENSTA